MKICLVIERLAGRLGGAERVLVELANELAVRGHSVSIVSHERSSAAPFYPIVDGISFRNLSKGKPRKGFDQRLARVLPEGWLKWRLDKGVFARRLGRFIERTRPDVVVPFLPPAMTATVLSRRSSCDFPIIFSTHNEPSQDYDNPLRWDSRPVDIAFRRKALSYVDRIVVLTREYRDWYPAELRAKVEVIGNPVQALDPTLLDQAQRQKKILAVGRLAKVKRFEELARAWKMVSDEFPDWSVHIFGDGPEREPFANLIRSSGIDRLYLRGQTRSIEDEYLSASLICHPAAYEGFPLAVSEALASGLPVMGFADCSGVNHLVRHGENGILIEAHGGDRAAAIAEALRAVLPDRERLKALGQAGPRSVEAYQPKAIYDLWERALTAVVQTKPVKSHRIVRTSILPRKQKLPS